MNINDVKNCLNLRMIVCICYENGYICMKWILLTFLILVLIKKYIVGVVLTEEYLSEIFKI